MTLQGHGAGHRALKGCPGHPIEEPKGEGSRGLVPLLGHECLFAAKRCAVVVVFGATGGIGAALAHRLHALRSSGTSAQVPSAVILSSDKEDRLKELQQALRGADILPADARDPTSVSTDALQKCQPYQPVCKC